MGIENRTYMHQGGGPGGGAVFRSGIGVGLPKPGPAIKWLLIINIAVFLCQQIFEAGGFHLSAYFGATLGGFWQLWRYITFQFLHGDFWHIGLNMLGLYFLGMPLENKFGTRKFIKFYLTCGVTAGLAYVITAGLAGLESYIPLVGASGGVYGIVLAAAVYFPHIKLLLFFFFPVPIRLAAVIFFGAMIMLVLKGDTSQGQFWSHIAHLGGAVAAAVWIWIVPNMSSGISQHKVRRVEGAWRKKMQHRAADQAEIDRILAKINQKGIGSLTSREKKTLQDATKAQQAQDNELYKP